MNSMTQESKIDLPMIKVPVHCVMVKKVVVCEITNASQYEYEATLSFLRKNDKAFAARSANFGKCLGLCRKICDLLLICIRGIRFK